MCFSIKQSKKVKKLENRFNAKYDDVLPFVTADLLNAFTFPLTPVITNNEPGKIQLYSWGLLPVWSKDTSFRKNTVNARIETIHVKPSFRNSINKRCMVLVDGFYEWQWLDEKGKKKQKYLLSMPDDEPFAIGGLWNIWKSKTTGEVINSYTILTTEANEQMAIIHNHKKRMPMILKKEEEEIWLDNQAIPFERDILLKETPLN